ncbi:polysaccharide deacetylase family protein [Bradyrhizobium sp. 183]|uniref:polysaccharide deacetylase family protein n=1 Tax=unclassified Bradyrhizobium TaxID=2631580 RepID=UPI001FFEC793|nr:MULTISPECIES: polysaccharide deacetylase family protein [unclassified Bradyrhizobium]UPJ79295.1 polysaccharide deacetylase family protein [Bradyrhizobium sp. 184]UPJ87088.1 polysaccharide deacetylase family protein [Bradyrhizobium sp. 183]
MTDVMYEYSPANDRYAYSPIIDRPVIRWPNGARVAFWLAPNVEYMEYVPQERWRDEAFTKRPIPAPNMQSYRSLDYGNRIAFWRMLDVIDKHDIRCTASLNEAVLDHFPEIRDAMVARNWDYMSHGIYNNRLLTGMTNEEEREFYRDIIETLQKHTGKRLKGMLGPAISATLDTPDLMAEAGLIYHTDFVQDDQPFPLKVKSGRLISLPYTLEVNDSACVADWGNDAKYFAQICKDQFDVLYEQGAESGRVMCIALHPYWIGAPHRVKYLDEILTYILSHDGVWKTTADDIADYYLANYYDKVLQYLEKRKAELNPGR